MAQVPRFGAEEGFSQAQKETGEGCGGGGVGPGGSALVKIFEPRSSKGEGQPGLEARTGRERPKRPAYGGSGVLAAPLGG